MKYYPIYLDLKDRAVLVVGGGAIAESKAEQLIEAGARVRVVSPELTGRLREWAQKGVIAHRLGTFDESDLGGVVLVISATDSQTVNQKVAHAAARRGLLCNVVDQPALCSFITPALITRGDLQISVSSGGGSPSLVQRVKREVAALVGEEYGALLELAAEMRAEAKRRVPDFEQRRALLHAFVESEALDLLRAGQPEEARRIARELLKTTEPCEEAKRSEAPNSVEQTISTH